MQKNNRILFQQKRPQIEVFFLWFLFATDKKIKKISILKSIKKSFQSVKSVAKDYFTLILHSKSISET